MSAARLVSRKLTTAAGTCIRSQVFIYSNVFQDFIYLKVEQEKKNEKILLKYIFIGPFIC